MIKLYLPQYYMFMTRYKSTLDKFSWLIQRIIPVFFVIAYQLHLGLEELFSYGVIYMLADMVFISFYEIGYIFNDVFTIKKERNPTIRLNKAQMKFLEKNIFKMTLIRSLISVILLVLILWLAQYNSIEINITNFSIIVAFMMVGFFLHNKIRGKFNIITFMILVFCKFSYALFLFIPQSEISCPLLMVLLMFPLPRIFENMSSKGFININKLVGSFDIFRIIYYCLLLVITIVYLIYWHNVSILLFYLALYFFIYRVGAYILIRMSLYKR